MKKIIAILTILCGLSLTLYFAIWHTDESSNTMSYVDFVSMAESGQVDEVILTKDSEVFEFIPSYDQNLSYEVTHPQTDSFVENLLLNNINITYKSESLSTALGILVVIGVVVTIFVVRKKDQSSELMKDSNKKQKNKSTITLEQVAGNTEAKAMVSDIISFIKSPEDYASVGAKMPRGLLFYGPPGTGKTLMAKAIAGEADVPFYTMSGSDFVQMYVGVGASRIRTLFKKAKKSEKAVIFIDEIDAIGKKRGRNSNASNDERDQTLNALLTEMSGFHDNQGILVIGATNRLDTLDEALLRPGRFDRHIEIGLPDINARKKILALHGNNKPMAEDVDYAEIARSTVYFSGAMLEHLLNEAAILAANDHSNLIRKSHIDTAFYTVLAGAPIQDRSFITDKEKEITAYHEAGHCAVTKLLLPDNHISKVTIIPSVRGAGGFNLSIPKDTLYQTKSQIQNNIKVLLAGRVAEELIYGPDNITTGASNDIQKASAMVHDYMNKYGMDSEIGLFSTAAIQETPDEQLLQKCRTLMDELYLETKALLLESKSFLESLTKELIINESLDHQDIDRIYNSVHN